jgi:hypothetical protein
MKRILSKIFALAMILPALLISCQDDATSPEVNKKVVVQPKTKFYIELGGLILNGISYEAKYRYDTLPSIYIWRDTLFYDTSVNKDLYSTVKGDTFEIGYTLNKSESSGGQSNYTSSYCNISNYLRVVIDNQNLRIKSLIFCLFDSWGDTSGKWNHNSGTNDKLIQINDIPFTVESDSTIKISLQKSDIEGKIQNLYRKYNSASGNMNYNETISVVPTGYELAPDAYIRVSIK